MHGDADQLKPQINPAKTGDASSGENPGGFVHIKALDGIRGTAILLVLFDHLFWSNTVTGSRLFDILAQLRGASYCGVNLFFALSGFLITGILFDTLNIKNYFRTFYMRRVLRIFPLYYGVLLLLLLLTVPLHLVWSGWQYFYLTYSANLALWHVGHPLNLGIFNINHFWSLQVEEQFYLLWPLVIYKLRKPEKIMRVALWSCAAVLCVRIFLVVMRGHADFNNIYLVYSPTFSCADNILFGCTLSALLRTRWREKVLHWAPNLFMALMAVLVAVGIYNHGLEWDHSIFVQTIGFSMIGAACAALVAMSLRTGSAAQGFFQNSILRFFGRYSYGLYVYHYSIAGFMLLPVRAWSNAHLHSKALSVLLAATATTAVTIVIALLSYHFFEVRFLRMKRKFSYSGAAPK